MKQFKGKIIYSPSGKAAEYSYWAANFYTGCSGGCTYCYLKKGILAKQLGGCRPTLKKPLTIPNYKENSIFDIFENELEANLGSLRKHGLFFSFTTDPLLPETFVKTMHAVSICNMYDHNVPCKILTKQTEWRKHVDLKVMKQQLGEIFVKNTAFGFTLTGHDELEPGCATNFERIAAMSDLKLMGFPTFASIEPIIDMRDSMAMVQKCINYDCCDLFKIGLLSGGKKISVLSSFMTEIHRIVGNKAKIYWKDSLLKSAGIKREDLPANCVSRDYNMFVKKC